MYKKNTFWKKNDIWQCTSITKTFLFNINLELQKSDENWRRNNTLKSAHTINKQLWEKRKWSEPTNDERSYKYPHRVSLNTAKLLLNEMIFYDWMHFLVHNIIGDYLKRKKFDFFLFFRYTLPFRGPTPFEDMIFYLWTDSNEICTAYVKLKIKHILFLKNVWFLI